MSRTGIVFLAISAFCILITVLVRTILGGWVNWLFVPFGLFFVCAIAGLLIDVRFYKEFLTMRTTKHGANMLTLIFFTLVLLVAINFVAVRKNIKWDLTPEGMNSLSDQTKKVLKSIDEKAKVLFFFRGGTPGIEQVRAQFKESIELYQDANSNVSVQFINSITRPGLAKEYGVDKAGAMVFVEYKGKKNLVEPLNEEGLTTALLKVTREKNKKIYALKGHGEKDINQQGPLGASLLKSELEAQGYDLADFSLVETGQVPKDADMVMVIGPKTQLLESELQALREYAKKGGRLLLAGDPGEKHNLAQLTKTFGVEYKNDYVLDQFGQIMGTSAAVALGRGYGSTGITKDFQPGMMTLFYLASSLEKAPDAHSSLQVTDVVSTGETSFTSDEIAQGAVEVQTSRRGPHKIGMAVTGSLSDKSSEGSSAATSKDNEFTVVIYGDSDFLANQGIVQQLNRDLAANSAAFLLKEDNLISIRPKQRKGTTLTLTETNFRLYLMLFIIPLPILLFGMGGFNFYRRRNA